MPVVGMKRITASLAIVALLGLPPAGVWLAGYDVLSFLEFPPQTFYVRHAPFSRPVFIVTALLILATVLPFLIHVIKHNLAGEVPGTEAANHGGGRFPWWGWLGLGLGGHMWILAWTRQAWFAPFQPYIFTPLWLAYILIINALTWRRTGRCLLTHETRCFLKLFPLSAAFWWFFEYLNRFVQNWWYVLGADFTPLQYFLAATGPFATVLPAVLSTEEWLAAHPRLTAGLECFVPVRIARPRPVAGCGLALSCAGLLLIGRFPDQLFPLLWVVPLVLMICVRALTGGPPFFPEAASGDWRRLFRLALAALICGFFWEMWNAHSLAKWIYSVPYVDRFHLFEMPLLGYAGYLPFGLECAVAASFFLKRQ